MKVGVRSEVMPSPEIPRSAAGSRRKSVTAGGVVLSILKLTTLLLEDAATWLGLLIQAALAETLNVPLMTGLPEVSSKSWKVKLKVPSDWTDEAGRVNVIG